MDSGHREKGDRMDMEFRGTVTYQSDGTPIYPGDTVEGGQYIGCHGELAMVKRPDGTTYVRHVESLVILDTLGRARIDY